VPAKRQILGGGQNLPIYKITYIGLKIKGILSNTTREKEIKSHCLGNNK